MPFSAGFRGGSGAIIGHAAGNTAAGAVIGAGVGALTGAAIGAEKDQEDARNRAMIEQQLHRQIAAGAASIQEVVSMTHAGVNEGLIINYVQTHGMVIFLQPPDLIYLKQQGVSDNVVQAMQTAPRVQPPVRRRTAAAGPVIIEGGPYGIAAALLLLMPREHYHFITGTLAESALRKVVEQLAAAAGLPVFSPGDADHRGGNDHAEMGRPADRSAA